MEEYELVAWDGRHINFGQIIDGEDQWESLEDFNSVQAQRLLRLLEDNGRPLVHPLVLSQLVGPESETGASLIPLFYNALVQATEPGAHTTKTKLLFTEWNRLFGQVIGIQSTQLNKLLRTQASAHQIRYEENIPQYILALSTHIALVAKLVAALSLPDPATDMADASVDVENRLQALEDGSLFRDAGVANILSGDFFTWYLDENSWDTVKPGIENLLVELQRIDFNVRRKGLSSVRDLFKGMYETFMPRALRHALGEFYTPDWLAGHALDMLEWKPQDQLLDPTCGTGTFILEAIKRRLLNHQELNSKPPSAELLLDGLYGMDLNPLAVLAARASIVVFLSPYISPYKPLTIPVWLADAINSAQQTDDYFDHDLLTEQGIKTFRIPATIVQSPDFHLIFDEVRELVTSNTEAKDICEVVRNHFDLQFLTDEDNEVLDETVELLVNLHEEQWDGIWCSILADRFTAGSIPRVSHIAGNPPWVKWSNLPPEYANFIKDQARRNGVFSQDTWFGGIESDISTVIIFEALTKWLQPRGKLAMFITGTVFSNESSQGFRKLQYPGGGEAAFTMVEDFYEIAPFEGVSNHPVLMMLQNDEATDYPVTYRTWSVPHTGRGRKPSFDNWPDFESQATSTDLLALPVYGSDSGPWLKGSRNQHQIWENIFSQESGQKYIARKGVCTDRNGIFFLRVSKSPEIDLCRVSNDPSVGRTPNIPAVRNAIVEKEHVFPLIRGKGIKPFLAETDSEYCILVPQRSMYGDPDLAKTSPRIHRFLNKFRSHLPLRASYRRYQKDKPIWSLWNVGEYTFAPYKVVWKEMSGNRFQAAYISSQEHDILGDKIVIPDHKVYFVPLWNEDEAAYLTGLLNAPSIAEAISAYSPNLSLGTNVVEHLAIPKYNPNNLDHILLAWMSRQITQRGKGPRQTDLKWLDSRALKIFRAHRIAQPRGKLNLGLAPSRVRKT